MTTIKPTEFIHILQFQPVRVRVHHHVFPYPITVLRLELHAQPP